MKMFLYFTNERVSYIMTLQQKSNIHSSESWASIRNEVREMKLKQKGDEPGVYRRFEQKTDTDI